MLVREEILGRKNWRKIFGLKNERNFVLNKL